MSLLIAYNATTGGTYAATIVRLSDGNFWTPGSSAFTSAPAYASKKIALTEGASENVGSYTATVTGLGDAGDCFVRIHDEGASNATVEGQSVYVGTPATVVATIAAGGITAASFAAGAFAAVKTLLLPFFQLLARSDAAAASDLSTELGELNADEGSGAGGYVPTTDSAQAIRDRGDTAWTGGGASATDVKNALLPFFQLLARSDAAAAADLSTELGEINADTGTGTGGYLPTTDSAQAIRDRGDAEWTGGGWDEADVVDGHTPAEALQIMAAVIAGEISGAGTGTETFKGLDGTTTRAVVTVDDDGNRSEVVY